MIVNEKFDQLCTDVKFIKHVITGNGSPETGLIVRVDRIEQKEKARSRWVGAAALAAVGAVVTTIWAKLTEGH